MTDLTIDAAGAVGAPAFHIRDLADADRAGWDALFAGYLSFYETRLERAQFDLTWRRLHDPAEPMFALVAQAPDGALIGLVQCVLHRSTWTEAPYLYLQDLFVAPDARDQGVGRALVEAVYARADALGAARVYWLTLESNATARILYDAIARRTGFIQYRRD